MPAIRVSRTCALLAACLVLLGAAPRGEAASQLTVVTTTSDLAWLAREVGGGKVAVTSLGKGFQDPHFIEPRPGDVVRVSKADVFAEMGLELEVWANPLLDAARNPHLLRLDCSRGIEVLEKPAGRVGPQHGDVHPFGNPHYQLDPENWRIMARNLADGLGRADPADAALFRANAAAFDGRVGRDMVKWTRELAPLRGTPILDYHRTWTYLAHRFGLEIAGYIEAKPGIPPSPAHLQEVIALVKARHIKAIFQETWLDRRYPDLVAHTTGARVLVMPSSIGAVPGTDDYEALFDRIVQNIRDGLR